VEDNLDFFELEYAVARARAGRCIEEAVGLNGYTTVAQAQTLCERLDLEARATLLDVGAGRGWPGSHVARTTGCRCVSTDVPWGALLGAKLQRESAVVQVRGGSFPFRGDSFDVIVHADVLC